MISLKRVLAVIGLVLAVIALVGADIPGPFPVLALAVVSLALALVI